MLAQLKFASCVNNFKPQKRSSRVQQCRCNQAQTDIVRVEPQNNKMTTQVQQGKEIEGDLIASAQNGDFDVIIHGCNCFCTMGKGIAKQIKEKFPQAFEADKGTQKGDRQKMGQISYAEVQNNQKKPLFIVNAYIQYNYRAPDNKVDYDSLREAFQGIKQHFKGKIMGYPLIGAGLAGGDWSTISKIIDEELAGEDHTLVRLPPAALIQK
eukprot:TRINITY_DN5771_c0_g1_i3.p1 TRINITY_DN5771_c0_g1~~TRINITY_DN5771_c0_g1_i3.p1  ORF type:complete len:210 (-),score=26.23 TRINITY_DN5771_c0_g1_i3:69-698(-)